MGDGTDMEHFKERAFEFLFKCYKLSGGDDSVPLDMDKVAKELGLEPPLRVAVIDHLLEKSLIRLLGLGSSISITAKRIARVEGARS
jgi:hypothetical protein